MIGAFGNRVRDSIMGMLVLMMAAVFVLGTFATEAGAWQRQTIVQRQVIRQRVVQPVVKQQVVVQKVVAQQVYAQPVYAQAVVAQSVYAQPVYAQAVVAQPVVQAYSAGCDASLQLRQRFSSGASCRQFFVH
jgi:hypothetical protein